MFDSHGIFFVDGSDGFSHVISIVFGGVVRVYRIG